MGSIGTLNSENSPQPSIGLINQSELGLVNVLTACHVSPSEDWTILALEKFELILNPIFINSKETSTISMFSMMG